MPRVLIVKPSSLGDIVHSIPVAHALARGGFEVHFAARRVYRPLLEMCPSVSKILDFPAAWGEAPGFVRELRSVDYDVVIDLQGLLRSGLATVFAHAGTRLGLPDSREGSMFFYHAIARYPAGTHHAVDRYWAVLKELGIQDETKIFEIAIPESARREAERTAGPAGYIVFSPTSRQHRKLWAADAWPRLAQLVSAQGGRVVVVGEGDASGDGRSASASDAWRTAPWANLIGQTTLPVLCGVISRAKLCVTVDSGPMHLAAALGVPVTALFGPTDPEKVGPYTPKKKILNMASDISDVSPEDVHASMLSLT